MAATRVSPTDLPELSLTVSRNGQGPAVVLLHGFPEIAYSWRHQIPVLADAGYQVIAPDQRGYGWSDQPEGVAAYAMTELVGDVIALLDHEEIDDAVMHWRYPMSSLALLISGLANSTKTHSRGLPSTSG